MYASQNSAKRLRDPKNAVRRPWCVTLCQIQLEGTPRDPYQKAADIPMKLSGATCMEREGLHILRMKSVNGKNSCTDHLVDLKLDFRTSLSSFYQFCLAFM